MDEFDDVLRRMSGLPQAEQRRIVERSKVMSPGIWVPNPGPQTDAYFSKADILLYGGEPGGGKSALLVGLAFNEHCRSLLFRRQYTHLSALTEYAIKVNGTRKGFNGSAPPRLTMSPEHFIDFGAASNVGDEQSWQGRPHDLIGLDEGAQLAEVQARFLFGWLRHENPKQRTRVVIASNPPLGPEGMWLVVFFAPWLQPNHPNPAKPGELRWFVTDASGHDREVPGPAPVDINGRMVQPISRTFIPASVDDNPYYAQGDYRKQLDNMQEPHRSLLMGGFRESFRDQQNQVIPLEWIRLAQQRWRPGLPPGVPMCAIAADASGGGSDPMVIASRYDGWFAPNIRVEAKDIPKDRAGKFCAGLIFSHRMNDAVVIVDLGGGYGSSMYEHLHESKIPAQGWIGSQGSTARTADGKLKFRNKRAEGLWKFREALDPEQPGGSPIMLPDNPRAVADLTAPTWEIKGVELVIESKEDVCARLGRSTDDGDAIIMCWNVGPTYVTAGRSWANDPEHGGRPGARPKAIVGREHARKR